MIDPRHLAIGINDLSLSDREDWLAEFTKGLSDKSIESVEKAGSDLFGQEAKEECAWQLEEAASIISTYSEELNTVLNDLCLADNKCLKAELLDIIQVAKEEMDVTLINMDNAISMIRLGEL